MRKLFANIITVVGSLLTLILCSKWYYQTREIEPLVGIIAASAALLTAGVYHFFPEQEKEAPALIPMTRPKTTTMTPEEQQGIERAIELTTKKVNKLRETLSLEDDPTRTIRYEEQLRAAEAELAALKAKLG